MVDYNSCYTLRISLGSAGRRTTLKKAFVVLLAVFAGIQAMIWPYYMPEHLATPDVQAIAKRYS